MGVLIHNMLLHLLIPDLLSFTLVERYKIWVSDSRENERDLVCSLLQGNMASPPVL